MSSSKSPKLPDIYKSVKTYGKLLEANRERIHDQKDAKIPNIDKLDELTDLGFYVVDYKPYELIYQKKVNEGPNKGKYRYYLQRNYIEGFLPFFNSDIQYLITKLRMINNESIMYKLSHNNEVISTNMQVNRALISETFTDKPSSLREANFLTVKTINYQNTNEYQKAYQKYRKYVNITELFDLCVHIVVFIDEGNNLDEFLINILKEIKERSPSASSASSSFAPSSSAPSSSSRSSDKAGPSIAMEERRKMKLKKIMEKISDKDQADMIKDYQKVLDINDDPAVLQGFKEKYKIVRDLDDEDISYLMELIEEDNLDKHRRFVKQMADFAAKSSSSSSSSSSEKAPVPAPAPVPVPVPVPVKKTPTGSKAIKELGDNEAAEFIRNPDKNPYTQRIISKTGDVYKQLDKLLVEKLRKLEPPRKSSVKEVINDYYDANDLPKLRINNESKEHKAYAIRHGIPIDVQFGMRLLDNYMEMLRAKDKRRL